MESALVTDEKPTVFVFFTNVNLTIGEKEDLIQRAKARGISFCEISDRERLRIQLNSPDGFFIRYQYLQIPLSHEEQASLFARWGDEIQSVIVTGFQKLERSLDRILFLQEASDAISCLYIGLELDREYSGDEIGHFRAFALFHLKEIKHRIFGILFGSCDKSHRVYKLPEHQARPELPGIKHGIGGGQWEEYIDPDIAEEARDSEEVVNDNHYIQVGCFSSIGMNTVRFISLRYDKDAFIRIEPTLWLKDIDQAGYILILNKFLAQKLKAIHVIANGYKLDEFSREDFSIDETAFEPFIPVEFDAEELAELLGAYSSLGDGLQLRY